jgi:outer membrane protein
VASRVGVINIQEAILSSNDGKKEFAAMQQRLGPKQAELKAMNDELDGLKKQAEAPGLTDAARKSLRQRIDAKQKSFQRSYGEAQNEFQKAEQEAMNRIGEKMVPALEKYAKAREYSVILDVGPQSPVLWAAQDNNITKEFVEAYNAEPTPAPAPAKP